MSIKDEIPELSYSQKDSVESIKKYSDAMVRLITAQSEHWKVTDGTGQDAATQRVQLEYRRMQLDEQCRRRRHRGDMFALTVLAVLLAGAVWPLVW